MMRFVTDGSSRVATERAGPSGGPKASRAEQALRRLEAALSSMEFAIERRLSESAGAESLSDELGMFTTDRGRPAERLDQAQAAPARLET